MSDLTTQESKPRPPASIAISLTTALEVVLDSGVDDPFCDSVLAEGVSGLCSVSSMFILLFRRSDQNAKTSSLESYRPHVYHLKKLEYRQVPFPTAQQVNLPAC